MVLPLIWFSWPTTAQNASNKREVIIASCPEPINIPNQAARQISASAEGESDKNKKLFDLLFEQKQIIESEFGESLDWERLDDRRASRIAVYREGSIDDVEILKEIQAWAIQELLKFRKAFSSRLKTYKSQVGL